MAPRIQTYDMKHNSMYKIIMLLISKRELSLLKTKTQKNIKYDKALHLELCISEFTYFNQTFKK